MINYVLSFRLIYGLTGQKKLWKKLYVIEKSQKKCTQKSTFLTVTPLCRKWGFREKILMRR